MSEGAGGQPTIRFHKLQETVVHLHLFSDYVTIHENEAPWPSLMERHRTTKEINSPNRHKFIFLLPAILSRNFHSRPLFCFLSKIQMMQLIQCFHLFCGTIICHHNSSIRRWSLGNVHCDNYQECLFIGDFPKYSFPSSLN